MSWYGNTYMSIVHTNGGRYGGAKNWHLTTYICWSEVTPTDYFVGTSFIVVDATRSTCSIILILTSQLLLKFLSTPLHELYVHMNENIAQYSSIHSLSVSHIFKSVDDLTDEPTVGRKNEWTKRTWRFGLCSRCDRVRMRWKKETGTKKQSSAMWIF